MKGGHFGFWRGHTLEGPALWDVLNRSLTRTERNGIFFFGLEGEKGENRGIGLSLFVFVEGIVSF